MSGGNNFNDFPDNHLTKFRIYWLIADFYPPPLNFYEASQLVPCPPRVDASATHNGQKDVSCLSVQGRTGSSHPPWLSSQTGPISNGVTRNSGIGGTAQISKYSPPSLAKDFLPNSTPSFPLLLFVTVDCPSLPSLSLSSYLPPVNGVSCLTYFKI